ANFDSAGDASSSGTLDLNGNAMVEGTLTNTGTMDLGTGFDIDGAVVNDKTMTQSDNITAGGGLTNAGAYTDNNLGYTLTTTDGGLSNSGQMTVGGINVNGGDFTNNGQFISEGDDLDVTYGNFTNGGKITGGSSVYVYAGDFSNNGSMAVGDEVSVTNGSIVNNGTISGAYDIETYSDASDSSFTAGGDYSITNAGTITAPASPGWIYFGANDQYNQADATGAYGNLNGSTGSFTNTGAVQVVPIAMTPFNDNDIWVEANNDINFGGVIQTNDGAGHVMALSASNPLYYFGLEAGNYDYNGVFTSTGVATLTTDVTTTNGGDFIAGNQVNLLS
ncbi:MAG: hypothetical protein ACRD04_07925, partial [Terriglobales bacterium]